jgi:hypothetical protein
VSMYLHGHHAHALGPARPAARARQVRLPRRLRARRRGTARARRPRCGHRVLGGRARRDLRRAGGGGVARHGRHARGPERARRA